MTRALPLVLTLALALDQIAFGEVRVTYLANEGVLIDSGNARVLIDSLFRDGIEPYARHSSAVVEQLETGKPPFDRITLALATHFHLDHWDAGSTARFLRSNSTAWFASTPDGTVMVPSALRDRVRSLWPKPGEIEKVTLAGVAVEAFPLVHGRFQNLGYRLQIGGRTLVHLGDAETTAGNFEALAASGAADVAMAPWWWLASEQGAAFLRERWKPGAVVAIHVGATDLPTVDRLQPRWPRAWLCRKPGESRVY